MKKYRGLVLSLIVILLINVNLSILALVSAIFPGFGIIEVLIVLSFNLLLCSLFIIVYFILYTSKVKAKNESILSITYVNMPKGYEAEVISEDGSSLSDHFLIIEKMLASNKVKGKVLLNYKNSLFTNRRLYSIQFNGKKLDLLSFKKEF